MVLSEVEETITIVEINDETYEEVIRVRIYYFIKLLSKRFSFMFIDNVNF